MASQNRAGSGDRQTGVLANSRESGEGYHGLAGLFRVSSGVLAAALLTAGAGGPAAAQPVELFPAAGEHEGYPVPPIGTEVTYSGGYALSVTDIWVEAGAVTVVGEHPIYGTERITLAYGLDWYDWAQIEKGQAVESTNYIFNSAVLAAAWPLAPGYSISYEIQEHYEDAPDDPMMIAASLEVLEASRLDTPMGRLPVVHTRLTLDLGPDDQGGRLVNTYERWFHPQFGLPVRMVDTYADGAGADTEVFDLVTISFPGQ